MERDSWSALFSAPSSRRHDSNFLSRSDLYLGFEEIDADDDLRAEFPCPYCEEDFDIVGLCCHIDEEHPIEGKDGVCPICANSVGMDLVEHITMQHGNLFKMHRRRRLRKGTIGSHSALSFLKKELRDGHLQSLLRGASHVISSSNAAPDPLLSSFINSSSMDDTSQSAQPPHSIDEGSSVKKCLDDTLKDESVEPPLSEKDKKERAQRSEFVQELLLSTIFLDDED